MDTLFHERSGGEVVAEAGIHSHHADPPALAHSVNQLVQDLGGVRLQLQRHLDPAGPGLGVVEANLEAKTRAGKRTLRRTPLGVIFGSFQPPPTHRFDGAVGPHVPPLLVREHLLQRTQSRAQPRLGR